MVPNRLFGISAVVLVSSSLFAAFGEDDGSNNIGGELKDNQIARMFIDGNGNISIGGGYSVVSEEQCPGPWPNGSGGDPNEKWTRTQLVNFWISATKDANGNCVAEWYWQVCYKGTYSCNHHQPPSPLAPSGLNECKINKGYPPGTFAENWANGMRATYGNNTLTNYIIGATSSGWSNDVCGLVNGYEHLAHPCAKEALRLLGNTPSSIKQKIFFMMWIRWAQQQNPPIDVWSLQFGDDVNNPPIPWWMNGEVLTNLDWDGDGVENWAEVSTSTPTNPLGDSGHDYEAGIRENPDGSYLFMLPYDFCQYGLDGPPDGGGGGGGTSGGTSGSTSTSSSTSSGGTSGTTSGTSGTSGDGTSGTSGTTSGGTSGSTSGTTTSSSSSGGGTTSGTSGSTGGTSGGTTSGTTSGSSGDSSSGSSGTGTSGNTSGGTSGGTSGDTSSGSSGGGGSSGDGGGGGGSGGGFGTPQAEDYPIFGSDRFTDLNRLKLAFSNFAPNGMDDYVITFTFLNEHQVSLHTMPDTSTTWGAAANGLRILIRTLLAGWFCWVFVKGLYTAFRQF